MDSEEFRALQSSSENLVANGLKLLLYLDAPPRSDAEMTNQYLSSGSIFSEGTLPKHLQTAKAHRKWGQEAWIQLLQRRMQRAQQRHLLRMLTDKIMPWVYHAERLMDFLTDCFNAGGDLSLLALAGLFHLMQEKNLDYPSFYKKLYSLMNDDLLHSKDRSRFFRLFDTFMSSTHLPAILVASFIKRLSRLALYAPPAGIVVVIPWIYNMFQRHPSCTFMMHRETPGVQGTSLQDLQVQDPYDMEEKNPMDTGAIDSCVWELVALQSHYHPNVATLAKIISEQFSKQQYNLEDFLDYSYKSVSLHFKCKTKLTLAVD
jgi:U3 small nucleolar RNA-associated protein 19